MVVGSVGAVGSVGSAVATTGAITPIAATTAAASVALAADGVNRIAEGLSLFKNSSKSSDCEENSENKNTPINQINEKIRRGQAPRSIDHAEHDHVPNTDHIHFKDGRAIYRNGEYKHGPYNKRLTNAEKEFLKENGFKLPKDE